MTVLARQQQQVAQGILVPAGGPLLGQEYFRIYDQTGTLWYWWISFDLAADWRREPAHTFDQEVRPYIVPWWLLIRDTDDDLWYVYPDIDGAPIVSVTPPPAGEGITNGPALRVQNGRARYRYTVVGGDLDITPA
jgi:hypothetical protein